MVWKEGFIISVLLVIPAYSMQQIVGIIGEPIRILCPGANPESLVTWSDRVYNREDAPQSIFVSEDNPDFNIHDSHPHKDNYMVDKADYTLTIKNITEEDGGEYLCSVEGDENDVSKYDLMVVGKPMCSGTTSGTVGGSLDLECEVRYRGSMPTVAWYSPDDEELRSDDRTVIRLMKKALMLKDLTSDQDGQSYMCKLSIGDFMESCVMTLNVLYPVNKVEIVPQKESYNAGDKLKCMANGNPPPKITFSHEGEGEKGEGWTTLVVKEEWVGTKQDIVCSAVSDIDGEAVELTNGITFTALEAVTTTLPPLPPSPKATEKTAAATQSSNNAGIIGGLIAAVAIIVIIVVIVVIVRKRSSKKPKGAKPVPTSDSVKTEMNSKA